MHSLHRVVNIRDWTASESSCILVCRFLSVIGRLKESRLLSKTVRLPLANICQQKVQHDLKAMLRSFVRDEMRKAPRMYVQVKRLGLAGGLGVEFPGA